MSFDAYTTAGQGQNLFQQLPIQSTRDPVNGVDFNDPGGGPYQIGRRWFNKSNENYWRYQGQGIWILDSSNPGPLIEIGVPAGTSPIQPDVNGLINFTSNAGTITISGSAGGLGAQNINFDLAGGGLGIDSIQVQAATAPGVNPVVPTAGGLMTVNGATVAAHSIPIETRTRAVNAWNIEAQVASLVSPTPANTNSVGLACYNTNQFQLDATSGMVSLKGSTTLPPILTESGDTGGAISPTAAGNLSHLGGGATTGIVTAGSANQIDYNVYRWVAPVANNWTPVVAGTTGAGVGTYIKQHGVYSRVGNMIFFTFDLAWSAHTGTGDMLITGFPKQFAFANTNYPYIAFVENITLPANTVQVMFNGTNATTQGAVVAIIDAATVSPVAMDGAGTICCYGFYFSDQA